MRVKNSLKNMVVAFITNGLTIIIGLLAQAVFIKVLNDEYLGINGLFNNIISMLGIVELGIGSAIIYNLYKPVYEKDNLKINALMNFYKKSYNIIAIIVLLLGLALLPFLDFFVKDVTIPININIVYILFIIDVVCSYLLSYKRSIINANQKNYLVNLIHVGYLILLNAFQIMILVLTHNYYIYLVIKIIMRLLENIILSMLADILYPYLNNKDAKLDIETRRDIFKKVKALFFHKIGGFIVLGTDNIIISKFLGIVSVGLYSNYYLVIEAVKKLFGQAISVLTPSVGNLLIENNQEKNFLVFKRTRFLNFWIATFSGIAILIVMDSFIKIWIGDKYILPELVLIVLVLNYFISSMRNSYMVFKEAAGIFHEDRYVPIIESVINIVASIVLLKIFGLAGVFMGTIISSLILWCYSYPKFVYKKLFNRSYKDYIKETLGYLLIFCILSFIFRSFFGIIAFDNIYLEFLIRVLGVLIVPNIVLLLMFYKTDNFKYYYSLLKKDRGD